MKRGHSRFTTEELNKAIENWEFISNEFNGEFELNKTSIDLRPIGVKAINPKKNKDLLMDVVYTINVKIPFKGRKIFIISKETKPPLIKYSIHNSDFSFSISNEDYFEKLFKLFGSRELQTGDKEFDKKYFLDTNDKQKLNYFLDNEVRNWLIGQKISYLDLNTPKSKNELSLYYIFNELQKENIRKQIKSFQYCLDRIK
jgi:hypothetical protein